MAVMAVLAGGPAEQVHVSAVLVQARAVASLVSALDPATVEPAHALPLWEAFDRIERLATSAKTLLAAPVADSGAWKLAGARSPAAHMARLSGTTKAAAQRAIDVSRAVAQVPAFADVLRTGELSSMQAEAIGPAVAADEDATERLVGVARRASVGELREACLRTRAAADPDPEATHRRIHRERSLRFRTDGEGAWRISGRGTGDQGALIKKAIERLVDERLKEVRGDDEPERWDAYAFDALVKLATHECPPATADGAKPKRRRTDPKYLALLRVDVEALIRGKVEDEETCDIVGIGPVPVSVARAVLGDAVLKLVVTKGTAVANVVHLGRGPLAAQRVALMWMQGKCANEACSSTRYDIDHREPWAATKRTRIEALDGLCGHDHWLKTHRGWALVDGYGRRAFVPPEDPRHPRHQRPPP
jgi:hypothetical protein